MAEVSFNDAKGRLSWILPDEAADALKAVPEAVQKQILAALSENVNLYCTGLLKAFGDPAKTAGMNLINQDIMELVQH